MPLQETKEVVGGILVVRYNGNNSSRSGARSDKSRRQEIRREKITAWQKAQKKARRRSSAQLRFRDG